MPVAPVVGVLLEHEALADGPLGELEGAGADRLFAEVAAGGVHRFLGHDRGEVQRHHVQEGGVGAAEGDLDGGRVDDLDTVERGGGAVGHGVVALDRAEEAGAGGLGLGVGDAVEGVFHVLGGHLAAVVELDAGAEVEGEGLAVLGDLVALGEAGAQLGGAGDVVHQAVEDRLDHRPVLPVVADRRIEGGHVVLVGDDDVAAGLGVGIGLVVLRRREGGEREEECRGGEQVFHWFLPGFDVSGCGCAGR